MTRRWLPVFVALALGSPVAAKQLQRKPDPAPDAPTLGVGLHYRHDEFDEVTLHVFVYPVGRVAREEALARVMQDVREGVAANVARSPDGEATFGEIRPLDLRRVAADGSVDEAPAATGDAPQATGATQAEDEALAMIARIDEASDPRLGQELSIRLSLQGRHVDSMALAFYRGLYLYKVRASVDVGIVPAESVERLARLAMAQLLPAIEVRNAGSCSRREIRHDPDAPDASRRLMESLVASQREAELEACGDTLDEVVPEGMRGIALVFPPGTWRQR